MNLYLHLNKIDHQTYGIGLIDEDESVLLNEIIDIEVYQQKKSKLFELCSGKNIWIWQASEALKTLPNLKDVAENVFCAMEYYAHFQADFLHQIPVLKGDYSLSKAMKEWLVDDSDLAIESLVYECFATLRVLKSLDIIDKRFLGRKVDFCNPLKIDGCSCQQCPY